MRKVILYIALSLDGYIADRNGGVAWLGGGSESYQEDHGYSEFIAGIDTVIMGYATYHQVAAELSPHEWPYAGKISYVLTHRALKDTDDIKFVSQPADELIAALKKGGGKNIWVCGGANVANQFMEKDLIDEYHLTVIPLLLGDGIPLFEKHDTEIPLELISSTSGNRMLDCVYRKKKSGAQGPHRPL